MVLCTDFRERGGPPIDVAVIAETRSTDIAAPRLLLVEDDVDARELLAAWLRDAGYEVDEAGDGRDALASIMREPPSLLITDCNMPNMSGNELVELLALDERLRSIPAIVISALKQPPLPVNVIVFLAKPFKMEQLRAAVCACLATASEATTGLRPWLEERISAASMPLLSRCAPANECEKRVHIERFAKHRIALRREMRRRRKDCDGDRCENNVVAKVFEQLLPDDAGHEQIHDDSAWTHGGLEVVDRLRSVCCEIDLVTVGLEQVCHRSTKLRIVLDDQHVRSRRHD